MAEQIVSPGVFQRETDQSFITPAPVEVGAAIVGPTVRGPIEQPPVGSAFADYKNKFGFMDSMSYLSSPIQWSRLGETNHVISSYMACYYPLESNQSKYYT